jgi:hypothetical protein
MHRVPDVPYNIISIFYTLVLGTWTRKFGTGAVTTGVPAMYNVAKIERDVLQ